MKSQLKSWYGAIIVVVVFAIIVISGFIIFENTGYRKYTNANTQTRIQQLQSKYNPENKLEYMYAYRAGCSRCDHMEKTVVPLMKRLKQHHQNLIVINVKNPSVQPQLLHNSISQVPAIRVTYHGKLVYQYIGYNRKYFRRIMTGTDPMTDKKFKDQVPPYGIVRNDVTHSIAKETN